MCLDHSRGVDQDLVEAYQHFDEGAIALDHDCTSYAGNLLMRGAGVKPDYKAAMKQFKKTKVQARVFYCILRIYQVPVYPC